MEIREVFSSRQKETFLPLLLVGDEEEKMVRRYLDRGRLFALCDGGLRAAAVVTLEGEGVCELKNLSVFPESQRKGYGRAMVEFLCEAYRPFCREMLAGTGESPLTQPFYERCGFVVSHRVPDFFVEHYPRPIWEGGVLLRDMVYWKRRL